VPLSSRQYSKEHPSACTCVECTNRRLAKWQGGNCSQSSRRGDRNDHRKTNRRGRRVFFTGIVRLCLNLAILLGFGLLVWHSYLLFTHKASNPLTGSILLITGIAVWVALIVLSRSRYKRVKPSFTLTTFLVAMILFILTFAGVQPMSTYKDNLFQSWKTTQDKWAAEREIAETQKVKQAVAMTPVKLDSLTPPSAETAPPKIPSQTTQAANIKNAERRSFELINIERVKAGVPATMWDEKLYELSRAHTQEMADRGELFHTPMDAPHGENAWGGKGYYRYGEQELATVIVNSWMTSPLHKAWLLHAPIKESVVSIVVSPDGQYASWSFWTSKLSSGPELVMRIADEWKNSGSGLDWIPWLESKGYLK